mmetsp:Transcript_23913/g.75328  ORF Transcript_23913/g.75328 Transcript_23913/m.75328 type:complete len:123 (+) Transcript_23913:662-1030(+)
MTLSLALAPVTLAECAPLRQRYHQVTKRGTEGDAVAQGGFGSSEFSRIAETDAAGVGGGVPKLSAIRTLSRWKFDPRAAPASVKKIDGIELTLFYDLNNIVAGVDSSKPSRVRKCRLELSRE